MCSAPQQAQLRDATVQHPDASKRPTRTAALLRPLAMLLSLSASLALSLLRIAAAAVRLAASAALGLRDPADSACACEFYEGVVHHLRTKPKRHTLTYRVRYCLLDLDAARPPACCAAQLEDRLTAAQARSESGYDGKVLLLLLPGSAGFEESFAPSPRPFPRPFPTAPLLETVADTPPQQNPAAVLHTSVTRP